MSGKLRITSPRSLPNLGLSICPGKIDPYAYSAPCARNLEDDVEEICEWGADVVVTLMEQWELEVLGVSNLGEHVAKTGMQWRHWQVIDGSPLLDRKGECSEHDPWRGQFEEFSHMLDSGGKIFSHCRGGLGRTGTFAARLLIERGLNPADAIREVREARPGAIETWEQENYLLTRAWME